MCLKILWYLNFNPQYLDVADFTLARTGSIGKAFVCLNLLYFGFTLFSLDKSMLNTDRLKKEHKLVMWTNNLGKWKTDFSLTYLKLCTILLAHKTLGSCFLVLVKFYWAPNVRHLLSLSGTVRWWDGKVSLLSNGREEFASALNFPHSFCQSAHTQLLPMPGLSHSTIHLHLYSWL